MYTAAGLLKNNAVGWNWLVVDTNALVLITKEKVLYLKPGALLFFLSFGLDFPAIGGKGVRQFQNV